MLKIFTLASVLALGLTGLSVVPASAQPSHVEQCFEQHNGATVESRNAYTNCAVGSGL